MLLLPNLQSLAHCPAHRKLLIIFLMENERGKLSVYIWGSGTRAKVSNIFTVQKATLSFPRVLTPSMCKAPDGKPFCKKNELIQLLKKKKKKQNSNVTLCSSAQKKQLPDCHQVTSLFSTVLSMSRYKTGEPVHLHNF